MWGVGEREGENDLKKLKDHTEKKKKSFWGNYHEGNVPNCWLQRWILSEEMFCLAHTVFKTNELIATFKNWGISPK